MHHQWIRPSLSILKKIGEDMQMASLVSSQFMASENHIIIHLFLMVMTTHTRRLQYLYIHKSTMATPGNRKIVEYSNNHRVQDSFI